MNIDIIPLSQTILGKEYIIRQITDGKTETKKLYSYGFMPGVRIKKLFSSPFGDPSAYEVLGTVIALRYSDSKNISVSLSGF